MAKSKKIVMTGGGTAGHVTPNIALMPALQEAGYEITYIGSYNGMEKELSKHKKSLISEFLLENFAVILTGKTFPILLKY